MNSLISVIIPAYNVETYISKCLESVFSQTYNNLEVIVINDGSSDDTADIITRYSCDPRLRYIEQINAGVSSARNTGIETATGEYIGFVDSDDYIEPDMYKTLIKTLQQADADMSVCNYNLVYNTGTEKKYSKMYNEVIDLVSNTYEYFCKYCAHPRPNNYIWTRLYKTNIVKQSNVRFENYKIGDDTLFNFKLLPHIKKAAIINEGYYNYVQRQDSNIYTAGKKVNLAEVYADTFEALAGYYETHASEELLSCLPIHAFSRLRSVYFYSRLAGMCDGEITKNIMTSFRNRKIAAYLTGAAK